MAWAMRAIAARTKTHALSVANPIAAARISAPLTYAAFNLCLADKRSPSRKRNLPTDSAETGSKPTGSRSVARRAITHSSPSTDRSRARWNLLTRPLESCHDQHGTLDGFCNSSINELASLMVRCSMRNTPHRSRMMALASRPCRLVMAKMARI